MEVKYSPFRFSSCVIVRCNLVMQFSGESSVASVYYCSTESRSLDFTSKRFQDGGQRTWWCKECCFFHCLSDVVVSK